MTRDQIIKLHNSIRERNKKRPKIGDVVFSPNSNIYCIDDEYITGQFEIFLGKNKFSNWEHKYMSIKLCDTKIKVNKKDIKDLNFIFYNKYKVQIVLNFNLDNIVVFNEIREKVLKHFFRTKNPQLIIQNVFWKANPKGWWY